MTGMRDTGAVAAKDRKVRSMPVEELLILVASASGKTRHFRG